MNNAPTDKSNGVCEESEQTRRAEASAEASAKAEARDSERRRVDGGGTDAPRRPADPYLPSSRPRVDADVAIVVVNRDGGAVLDLCVESLLAQQGVTSEVLVVDNASLSGEAASLRERFPAIRVVPLSANLGFAGGANEGIARTSAPFVLVVNNDARLAPDYAARLAARLAGDDRLAGVQGLVLSEDGRTVDTAGLSWNARGEALPLAAGEDRFAASIEAVEVPGVSATAAMYRRAALGEVSPDGRAFDDAFFAYYEDVDLSLRLARAGWRFALDPEAIAFHRGSMTGSRTPWRRAVWIARNRWRTLLKNFDRDFLRHRLADLLRADLAHARALGGAGWLLPIVVWPAAAWKALFGPRENALLTAFPAALPPSR